jgi:hypothetical protein
MKYLLLLIALVGYRTASCQASSSSDFHLKIKFDKGISVTNIKPHYLYTNGNQMERIVYKKDTLENSIVIEGHNHYILWVSFPVLVFTITENIKLPLQDEKSEKTTFFYLLSNGPLSSYTGQQTKDINFSIEYPIIEASIENHNKENAFSDLTLTKVRAYSEDANKLNLSNEMVVIQQFE